MKRGNWPLTGLLLYGVLTGCAPKAAPLPAVQPVPPGEDLSTFQAPSLYVPPPAPVAPPPPVPRPLAQNEVRYDWEDGKADLVQVGVGYPTVVRFEPGEVLTAVMDGDRDYLASPAENEDEKRMGQTTPKKDQQPNCYYGARWQWCKGVSESHYTPIEHLVFTTTHAGHKQGVVVFSDRRQYYLELLAVRVTKTRLVSWTYPPAPVVPAPPKAPGLFPTGTAPRQYHVGCTYTTPTPTPEWTPLQVVSDPPSLPSAKMYLRFAPVVLHQRMPLLRGLNELGTPYLLNARQYGTWVVVDELAPRLELRRGAGDAAQVVVITRDHLRPITCPGDGACPVFP